ncbi:MAG: hypothetical protein V1646_05205 [bacterium]
MKFRCMNKLVYLLFFLFLTQPLVQPLCAMNQIGLGDIDLSDIDMIEDDEKDSVQTRMDDTELIGAASALADGFKQPIWENTKAPEGRDILYHIPYKIAAIEYGGIAGNLFFNMTNRMNTSSSSLMGQLQGERLEKLEDVMELLVGKLIGPNSQDVLSSVVPILGKITIQEHKLGALFQGGFIKGPFSVQLHTSLQVAERNFYISTRNQKIVRDTFSKYDQGGEFDRNELIYWRFGMGDTRLKIGMNTLNMTDFQNDFGFECIIPTSQLSHSPKITADPSGILDDTSSNEALQNGIVDVLKGMRDYLIDPRLGNGGHFAFGCYMESKADLFHRLLQLWMRASYDKLFPGDEYRLFMYKTTITPNDLQVAAETGDADIVRPVLQKFLQEYLLPTSFKSDVHPGGIFNFVFAASTEIKKMRFAIGYDYYAQQKESIDKIYNTNVSMSDLKVEDTESDSVEQHKVFAEAVYVKKYKRCDLGVGLGGDTAIYSRGIGDDWTVYFKVAASF